jgi:signal transduction histidine kinase
MRVPSFSVRARLTLWYAGALTLIVCIFSAGILLFVGARLYAALDEQLGREIATIGRVYREEPDELKDLASHWGITLFQVDEGGNIRHQTEAWEREGLARALHAGGSKAPISWTAPNGHRDNAEDEFGRLATVFNDTLSRLQDAFERLRRFTADASHELRTPLTAMRSVGEVALRNTHGAKVYRDVIGSMLEEVDRLTRLVESLLTLTRGDSGRVQLASQTLDLAGLAGNVIDQLRVLADEKQQDLTLRAAVPVHAMGDPALVRQALTNVIHNAIKYTPNGGAITVEAKMGSGRAVIEVRDTGPGIPATHRDRIFDRFYRVDASRSREEGGVGLGLAIARWAIEANGGQIEVASDGVDGTLFRVVLPTSANSPIAR